MKKVSFVKYFIVHVSSGLSCRVGVCGACASLEPSVVWAMAWPFALAFVAWAAAAASGVIVASGSSKPSHSASEHSPEYLGVER